MAELMTPLETLTAEVNELQGEIQAAARTTLETAAECGRKLAQIRDQVPDFKAWCGEHFVASRQTAYNWIDIHLYREVLACQTVGHVGEALKVIAQAKKDAKRESENDANLDRIEAGEPDSEPADLAAIDRASGEPTAPRVEPDARRKVAQIAQRLEAAQAIVGAAVAEMSRLVEAAEGSERDWLDSLRGWVVSANDDLVEFVELGMTGGGQ